jgi:cupin superfamily acireductone dioxygenase involved in methionine salvage
MVKKELIEQKIGEAIGLEKAAQKAVDELKSKELLKAEHEKKLVPIKEEANKQQREMEELIEEIAESEGFDVANINSVSEETAQKVSKIMETYLEEEPDTQEALEFLCLAEGAEVTHYEVLTSVVKEVKSRKFGNQVRKILKEENNHLEVCTKLAKQNVSKE